MRTRGGGIQTLLDRLRGDEEGTAQLAGGAGQLMSGMGGVGKVAGGALSGAATGSAIAPGVGTAIGAVVGGIGGALDWKKAQHQKQMEALAQMRGRM